MVGKERQIYIRCLQEANKKIGELADEVYCLKNPKDGIWRDGKEEANGEFIFGIDSDGFPYAGYYKKSVKLKEWAYVDDLISIRNKNEWSEEDEENYKILLSHLRYEKNSASIDIKRKEWGRLESWFKRRVPALSLGEEDKKMIENIISDLRELRNNETNEELIADYEREIEWLKEKI